MNERNILERVEDYYHRHLTGRIYNHWKEALTRKYLIQQHEHRLAQLQENVLMRWAFERWKTRKSSYFVSPKSSTFQLNRYTKYC